MICRSLRLLLYPQLYSVCQYRGFIAAQSHTNSMESETKRHIIGVVQMTCTADKEKNFTQSKSLIEKAQRNGAQMVFLPEATDYIASSRESSLALAESVDGPIVSRYRTLARENNLWLSLGGMHIKSLLDEDKRSSITHLIIDSCGQVVSKYQKLHLFDVDIPGKFRLQESDYTKPGNSITPPVSTPVGNVASSICYDMRFPELATLLTQQGAHILTYPSVFTIETGTAHWESILRCRAIENQCYVVAAAQVGKHNEKRSSYGHSMVVDPWGRVIAQNPKDVDVIMADIDLELLMQCRTNMPVQSHRRYDLYGHITAQNSDFTHTSSSSHYKFGTHDIHPKAVFYNSPLSFSFMSNRPVLPGHTLVSPLRLVSRFSELSPTEVSDLYLSAQRVSTVLERHYNATSMTISMQDGRDAGQSVPHVHVHVLPRKPGDFSNNDDIYDKLEHHDETDRKLITEKELIEIAEVIRPLFNDR